MANGYFRSSMYDVRSTISRLQDEPVQDADRGLPDRRSNIEDRRSLLAFTLVELLVVVAIIALLISILLPALNKAKDIARSVACTNNLHQMGVGSTMYTSEYNGVLIPAFVAYDQRWLKTGASWSGTGSWLGGLRPYLGLDDLDSFQTVDDAPIAVCPAKTDRYGYGHNLQGCASGTKNGNLVSTTGFRKVQSINHPSEMVHLIDNLRLQPSSQGEWSASWHPHVRWPGSTVGDVIVDPRHPGESANILFVDAHASNHHDIAIDASDEKPHWDQ